MCQIRKVSLNQCGQEVYYSLQPYMYLTVLLESAECYLINPHEQY